jgi:hypothetical protein
MKDGRVGEELSKRFDIAGVERLIASTNQLFIGVCHGPSLPE